VASLYLSDFTSLLDPSSLLSHEDAVVASLSSAGKKAGDSFDPSLLSFLSHLPSLNLEERQHADQLVVEE
jgi:hypothetical protein